MQIYTTEDLESIIDSWQYWCPNNSCRNRTCRVVNETSRIEQYRSGKETKYIIVRVLACERCGTPMVIGTNVYHNTQLGWGARGETMTVSNAKMHARLDISHSQGPIPYQPIEYVAFTEPVQERELPKNLNKKIVESFREAEYGVAKNKPISAAAAIRNTVRLIVEDHGISTSENLKVAVKQLPFDTEYVTAMGNLKIIGDDTLHNEGYEISELKAALEVLVLAVNQHSTKVENLASLHRAVSGKASDTAKKI